MSLPDAVEATCTLCGETKVGSEFYWTRGKLRRQCKDCLRPMQAERSRRRRSTEEGRRVDNQRRMAAYYRDSSAGKAYNRARTMAVARLIEAHPRQFAALFKLARDEVARMG